MFKKKLGFLLGVMVLLSVAGYLVCLFGGSEKKNNTEESFLIVTSFYPMYVLAENLTQGIEEIEVANLTENQTGCLHDYQLTNRDMKLLSRADAFLINGAGMELFMEKIISNNADLPIIEASHEIALLEGEAHNHDHGEELHEEHDHGEHVHSHEENGHVWMDVERYRLQAVAVTEELTRLLPQKKDALEAAALNYDKKLQMLSQRILECKEYTEGAPVVIFHEAFAYFAESLGMEVLVSLALDEESVPSAGELAELIEEIEYHGGAVILIEEEYAEYADKIQAETDAVVVHIDPLTKGDGSENSYIEAMQRNLDYIYSVFDR